MTSFQSNEQSNTTAAHCHSERAGGEEAGRERGILPSRPGHEERDGLIAPLRFAQNEGSGQSSGDTERLAQDLAPRPRSSGGPSPALLEAGLATVAKLSVEGVSKAYRVGGRITQALENVTLHADAGEFVTVIGSSGCGKSTLFHLIAGLQQPDAGVIRFDGQPAISRVGRSAYMFQKDLLLPWRRLLDNVVLAQEVAGIPQQRSYEEARALLPLFGLEGFERSYPGELSGGMRQRAALLRTFLAHREVMLLDEPFGALDSLTRAELQSWLLEVWERFRQTILFITHDVEEAVFLSDRVYVMSPRPGQIRDEIAIDLPRPRHRSVTSTVEFLRLRDRLITALLDGARV